MNYTESHYLENKQHQLLKMVNFYDRQVDVLKEIIDDFILKYYNQVQEDRKNNFYTMFTEKKKEIEYLKNALAKNNFLLTNDINYNHGKLVDTLVYDNEKLENEIKKMEIEINELSKKIKLYIINKI